MNENELYSPINKEHGPIVEFIEKYPTLLAAPTLIRINENIFLKKIMKTFKFNGKNRKNSFRFETLRD